MISRNPFLFTSCILLCLSLFIVQSCWSHAHEKESDSYPESLFLQKSLSMIEQNMKNIPKIEEANIASRKLSEKDLSDHTRDFVHAARNRRQYLKKLMKEDPRSAFQFLMNSEQRKESFGTRAIQNEDLFEYEIQENNAELHVMCATSEFSSSGESLENQNDSEHGHRLERMVVVKRNNHEIRYDAIVYGQMEQVTTSRDIPIRGFVIDDTLLVDENSRNITADAGGAGGPGGSGGGSSGGSGGGSDGNNDPPTPVPNSYTTGSKTILYIRVDFSDRPGDPVALSTVNNVLTQTKAFVQENSYGQMNLQSWAVTPTLRMPRTLSWYASNANHFLDLLNDARNVAAQRGFSTGQYSFYMVAFTKIWNGWAGRGYVGSTGLWLNGAFTLRVTAHELGHNLGLWHANFYQSDEGAVYGGRGSHIEYGDVFDIMGNGPGLSNHFNLKNKRVLNWAPSSSIQRVSSSGTYEIFAHDDERTGRTVRGLEILWNRRITNNFLYLISYRSKVSNPYYSPGEGLLDVHMTYSSYQSSNSTHQVDSTPNSSGGRNDASIGLGKTLTDRHTSPSISVTFQSRECTASGCRARVRVDFLGTSTQCHEEVISLLTQNDDVVSD